MLHDAAGIAAVHTDARRVGYQGFISDELLRTTFGADLTAIWAERLAADEPPVVYVATRDGDVVGYCMLLLPSDGEDSDGAVAELTRMSVSPKAWRSGVGTALMREVVDSLRGGGLVEISVWVLERNSRARAFYSRFGFQLDGAQMADPWSGQTEVRMRLSLTRPRVEWDHDP